MAAILFLNQFDAFNIKRLKRYAKAAQVIEIKTSSELDKATY
jgi:hypothetical protein